MSRSESPVSDTGDITAVLSPYVTTVEEAIQQQFGDRSPQQLYDQARAVLTDETPLYGAIALAFADAVGGVETNKSALSTAVPIEQIRAQGVVHTDSIDASEDKQTSKILVGDILYAKAFETLVGPETECDRQQDAFQTLVTVSRQLCEGHFLRHEYERQDNITEESYLSVLRLTNGAIGGAAGRLGVTVAGGSERLARQAETYGRALGIAIGLHDDVCALLDCLPILGHRHGHNPIQTIATIHAREEGIPIERLVLFGDDTDRVVAELDRAESLVYAHDQIADRASSARGALMEFPETDAVEKLHTLPGKVVERSCWY